MRTTVDLDPHLLKRLRAEAHRRGVPFKDVLTAALRSGLERQPATRGRYRCPTFAMGRTDLSLDKALAIAAGFEDEEIARKLALRK